MPNTTTTESKPKTFRIADESTRLRLLANASSQVMQRGPALARIIGPGCALGSFVIGERDSDAFDASRMSRSYDVIPVLDAVQESSGIILESVILSDDLENVLESVKSNLRPLRTGGRPVAAWPLIMQDSGLGEGPLSAAVESLIERGVIYEPTLGFFGLVE